MNKVILSRLGIIGVVLVAISMTANSQSDSKVKVADHSTAASVDETKKADKLGIDIALYRKIGIAAQGYRAHAYFKTTIDLEKHPTNIEISSLEKNNQEIPEILRDEANSLAKLNYLSIAKELNLSEARFFELLIGYMALNNTPIKRAIPSNKKRKLVSHMPLPF